MQAQAPQQNAGPFFSFRSSTRRAAMAALDFASQYIPRKKLAIELGERLRGRPYSEMTLIAWEKNGKGPPVTRIGRDVLYAIPSVEKWLKQQEQAAKASRPAA
jgi:hypothetical protein